MHIRTLLNWDNDEPYRREGEYNGGEKGTHFYEGWCHNNATSSFLGRASSTREFASHTSGGSRSIFYGGMMASENYIHKS